VTSPGTQGDPGDAARFNPGSPRHGIQAHGDARIHARASGAVSCRRIRPFDRQIHRYAALGEDTQDYAERCQFLVEELRAQVEEETNRNLYTLTMFSVTFLPATRIASIWGMNVGGVPFSGSPNGFWLVAGLIAAIFTLFAIVLYLLRFRFF